MRIKYTNSYNSDAIIVESEDADKACYGMMHVFLKPSNFFPRTVFKIGKNWAFTADTSTSEKLPAPHPSLEEKWYRVTTTPVLFVSEDLGETDDPSMLHYRY